MDHLSDLAAGTGPRTSIRLRHRRTWAARTIFCPAAAHLLDPMRSCSKNGFRVNRRLSRSRLRARRARGSGVDVRRGRPRRRSCSSRLARALRVPHVAPARSAAVALDLTTGTVLFTQNGNRPLAPASNEKLPLTYAALVRLGPTFRIATDVLGEGEQDGTTVDRRARPEGQRRSDALAQPTCARSPHRCVAAGIRRVTGEDRRRRELRSTPAASWPGGSRASSSSESPPLSALVVDRARVGWLRHSHAGTRGGDGFPRRACAPPASPSTGPVRTRPRRRVLGADRAGVVSDHSRRSSASWTARATTSPPRCC